MGVRERGRNLAGDRTEMPPRRLDRYQRVTCLICDGRFASNRVGNRTAGFAPAPAAGER